MSTHEHCNHKYTAHDKQVQDNEALKSCLWTYSHDVNQHNVTHVRSLMTSLTVLELAH